MRRGSFFLGVSFALLLSFIGTSVGPAFALKTQAPQEASGLEELGNELKEIARDAGFFPVRPEPFDFAQDRPVEGRTLSSGLEESLRRHVQTVEEILDNQQWDRLEPMADELMRLFSQGQWQGTEELDRLVRRISLREIPPWDLEESQERALRRWEASGVAFLVLTGRLSQETAHAFLADPASLEGHTYVTLSNVWISAIQRQQAQRAGIDHSLFPSSAPGGAEQAHWQNWMFAWSLLEWTTPTNRYDPTRINPEVLIEQTSGPVLVHLLTLFREPGTQIDSQRILQALPEALRRLGPVPPEVREAFFLREDAAVANLVSALYRLMAHLADRTDQLRLAELFAQGANGREQAIHTQLQPSFEVWVPTFRPPAGLEENRSPDGKITAQVKGKEVAFRYQGQAPVRLSFLAPIASVLFSPDSLNAIVRTDPTPSIHLLDLSPLASAARPNELWLRSVSKKDEVTFESSKKVLITSPGRRRSLPIHLDVLTGRTVPTGLEEISELLERAIQFDFMADRGDFLASVQAVLAALERNPRAENVRSKIDSLKKNLYQAQGTLSSSGSASRKERNTPAIWKQFRKVQKSLKKLQRQWDSISNPIVRAENPTPAGLEENRFVLVMGNSAEEVDRLSQVVRSVRPELRVETTLFSDLDSPARQAEFLNQWSSGKGPSTVLIAGGFDTAAASSVREITQYLDGLEKTAGLKYYLAVPPYDQGTVSEFLDESIPIPLIRLWSGPSTGLEENQQPTDDWLGRVMKLKADGVIHTVVQGKTILNAATLTRENVKKESRALAGQHGSWLRAKLHHTTLELLPPADVSQKKPLGKGWGGTVQSVVENIVSNAAVPDRLVEIRRPIEGVGVAYLSGSDLTNPGEVKTFVEAAAVDGNVRIVQQGKTRWLLPPSAGLEEQPRVLDFTGAAGAALQQTGIPVSVIAETSGDYGRYLNVGIQPRHVTGLLWGGLEEADYLQINPGIGALVGIDPTAPGWRQQVQQMVSAQAGTARVIVVTDAESFLAGLEELGLPPAGVDEATQVFSTAQETLSRMQ